MRVGMPTSNGRRLARVANNIKTTSRGIAVLKIMFPTSRKSGNEIHRFIPFWRTNNDDSMENFHFPDIQGAGMNVFNISENGGCFLEPRKMSAGFKMPNSTTTKSIQPSSCALPLFPPCDDGPSGKYGEIFLQRYANRHSEFSKRRNFNLAMVNAQKKVGKDKKLKADLGEINEQIRHSDKIDVNIPPFVLKLVESLPTNWKETCKNLDVYDDKPNYGRNGCIASFSFKNPKLVTLLHSYGKKYNKISVSKIPMELPLEEQVCTLNIAKLLEFDDNLLHLATVKLQNTVYCGMRFTNSVRLGTFNANEFQEMCAVAPKTNDNTFITDFAMSPFIAGEFIYVDNNGLICSHNMEKRVAIHETIHKRSQFKTKIDNWWSCEYGAHPRCTVIAHKTGCYLRDLRQGMTKTVNLISSPLEVLMKDELIRCHVRSPGNCFRHWIGCDNALVEMDERFPDHPVLLWDHMLKTPPHLCHSAILPDKREVVLLAGENSNAIACFVVATNNADAVSLMPPLHLSSPMDMANFLMSDGHSVNPLIESRLSAPLTGILAVPHKSGFLAVQQNKFGDIFYQSFNNSAADGEESFRFSNECSSGLVNEKGIKIASEWCKNAAELIEKAEVKTAKSSYTKQTKNLAAHDMECAFKYLARTTKMKHNEDCALCCNCGMLSDMHVNEPLAVCEKCGIHSSDAKALLKAAEKGGVMAGPVAAMRAKSKIQRFPKDALKQVKSVGDDFLSALDQRLLSIWEDDNVIEEEQSETSSVSIPVSSQNTTKRGHQELSSEDEDIISSEKEDPLETNEDHHKRPNRNSEMRTESQNQRNISNSLDIFGDESALPIMQCSQSFDFPSASQGFTLGDSEDFSFLRSSAAVGSQRSNAKYRSTPNVKSKHTSGF